MSNPIRKLPAQDERVETGPIQFGDDWTGLFIRGDNAFHFYITCKRALESGALDPFDRAAIEGLAELLKSSQL